MAHTRREFLETAALAAGAVALGQAQTAAPAKDGISFAAWSINRSFFENHRWTNLDLPRIVREEFGINGLEFVNQFFENPTIGYLRRLRQQGAANNVTFVLIMIDDEGDMAARDKNDRMQAAIAHRKWVDIAHFLGCKAVRCNLGGPRTNWKTDTDLVSRAAESFSNLLEYAKDSGLCVLIENHGGASSDPDVLVPLMKTVNNPKFGVLPDFGNINPGDDNAEVIRKIVPWAKVSISVKASWATDETNPGWDLEKILKICQDSGYHGFWGIESSYGRPPRGAARPTEKPKLTPDELWQQEVKGVKLTKAVLERVILKKT